MHIVHVTPHLPPDQAANALLPWQLGTVGGRGRGHRRVRRASAAGRAAGDAAGPGGRGFRAAPTASSRARCASERCVAARRIQQALEPAIDRADVVHVHSNGLLAELAVLLSRRRGKPVVLTLYGTEIWHYAPKRFGPDLFTRAYQRGLGGDVLQRAPARPRPRARPDAAAHADDLSRRSARSSRGTTRRRRPTARESLGIANRHLLVNVKRLHPLAGQRFLIEAMNEVVRTHPDTRLVICGTGALLDELQAAARSAGVERHVTFAGLVDNAVVARYCAAADLFVLPSMLEALPTVAVEALACGTPVISTDNPGGLELNDVFGRDVSIVPREQPLPLGARDRRLPARDKRRTDRETRDTIEREFRPGGVAAQYRALYARRDGEGATHDARPRPRARRGAAGGLRRRHRAGALLRLDRRRCTSTSTSRRRAASSTASTRPSATRPPAGRLRGPGKR